MSHFIRGMGSVLVLGGSGHGHYDDLLRRSVADMIRNSWERVGRSMWGAIMKGLPDQPPINIEFGSYLDIDDDEMADLWKDLRESLRNPEAEAAPQIDSEAIQRALNEESDRELERLVASCLACISDLEAGERESVSNDWGTECLIECLAEMGSAREGPLPPRESGSSGLPEELIDDLLSRLWDKPGVDKKKSTTKRHGVVLE